MKKIYLLIFAILTSFVFIIKPSADTVTDANIYIDTKKMVDTSWLSPSVNTYLDITAGAKFYSIGKYYVQYNVCFPKRDSMTITCYSDSPNNMTVKNTYKECTYSNNKTKGYTYSIIVMFNTWNGVQSNGSYYGTSSKIYFTSDNSSTVSIQLIDITVLDENQLQIIDGLDTLDKNQQETNEKLDNIDNTMKDDNIDTSSSNSFFNDFDTKDHGGLSSIVTSPLKAYAKITAKCTPINMTVLDKPITLPCGDTLFWNKSGVSSFRIIWNILLGGPILYALLVKLFNTIERLKNPDDDRIEVAKL